MPIPFVPPTLEAKAFNCPLCGAYSQHLWRNIIATHASGPAMRLGTLAYSTCLHCDESLLWSGDSIVVPDVSAAPPANEDLSPEIRADYAEAASIATKSPRGAAALLRLALQKLCIDLGGKGKNINDDIAALVVKGLDIRVQQALDTVRVIGNEAVHPGEIDLRDDAEAVGKLFGLINFIADAMLTQPKERDKLFNLLPAAKIKQIENRDGKSAAGTLKQIDSIVAASIENDAKE